MARTSGESGPASDTAAFASTFLTLRIPGITVETTSFESVNRSAVVATLLAFASGTDLDFTDQVTVIATPPAHRQLATVGSALLNSTKPARVLTAAKVEPMRGARVLVSDDAAPEDAAKAKEQA